MDSSIVRGRSEGEEGGKGVSGGPELEIGRRARATRDALE